MQNNADNYAQKSQPKKNNWIWWTAGVIGLLVIIVIFSVNGNRITSIQTSPTKESVAHKIGDKITLGDKELVIYSIGEYKDDYLKELLKTNGRFTEGDKLFVVDAEIKNIGKDTINYLGEIKLKDSNNKTYGFENTQYGGKKPTLDMIEPLSSGSSVRGYITFPVSKDGTITKIVFNSEGGSVEVNSNL